MSLSAIRRLRHRAGNWRVAARAGRGTSRVRGRGRWRCFRRLTASSFDLLL